MRIRNQIRPHDPKDFMRAMEIAVDLEEAIKEERKMIPTKNISSNFRHVTGIGKMESGKGWSAQVGSSSNNTARKEYNQGGRVRARTSTGEVPRNKGVRTLLYMEYIKRREEGRCYHCGGPYSYGHRIPNKNPRVIICGEAEEGLDSVETDERELSKRNDEEEERGWNQNVKGRNYLYSRWEE